MGAVRLAVVFSGGYVILSVVALIARGQWLTKIGPVEVSEQVVTVDRASRKLEEELSAAQATIDMLRQQLAGAGQGVARILQNGKGSE